MGNKNHLCGHDLDDVLWWEVGSDFQSLPQEGLNRFGVKCSEMHTLQRCAAGACSRLQAARERVAASQIGLVPLGVLLSPL